MLEKVLTFPVLFWLRTSQIIGNPGSLMSDEIVRGGENSFAERTFEAGKSRRGRSRHRRRNRSENEALVKV